MRKYPNPDGVSNKLIKPSFIRAVTSPVNVIIEILASRSYRLTNLQQITEVIEIHAEVNEATVLY